MKEEYAIVLDFLEHGHGGKGEPLAQVIGEKYFTLLEVVLRDGVIVQAEDRIYIGEGERKEVKYIKGKISIDDLTANARAELDYILEELVEKNEDRFIKFFNEAAPITTRLHALELLPGIGKKHMWNIIEEREKKKFESFEDIKNRVKLIPNPEEMIAKRLKMELEGNEKWYLFITPPRSRRHDVSSTLPK